jgi:hypothetical protein
MLLLAALCTSVAEDTPAPLPTSISTNAEQSPMTAGGVVSGAAPSAILGTLPEQTAPASNPRLVWGVIDGKFFPDAGRLAPNGSPYNPIFSLDGTMNVWLWPRIGLYAFGESRFWGQRGTPGQTHGNFDYTKREFDLTAGFAWNYLGFLELRAFAYAYNNLNRGSSPIIPAGYNDGTAVEQRLYLAEEYARLGQDGFNISRATFVSIGYYPSKQMIGVDGQLFTPSLFVRAYLTWDIPGTCCYLYGDTQLICERGPFRPNLLLPDLGVAIVPFEAVRLLEIRLGVELQVEFGDGNWRGNTMPYVSVRLNY